MNVVLRMLIVLNVAVSIALGAMLILGANASREAAEEISGLEAVREQAEEIEQLVAATAKWARRGTPSLGKGGLAGAMNDCLSTAGVSPSSLAAVSPAAESPLGVMGGGSSGKGEATAMRRRATATLAPVTLEQLGRVIAGWRDANPEWTISSIDLAPEPLGRREPAPGSDLPLRAVLVLETLFAAERTASSGGVH